MTTAPEADKMDWKTGTGTEATWPKANPPFVAAASSTTVITRGSAEAQQLGHRGDL